MQYWHTISKEELLGKLHTTEKGLLIEEIEERERKYGKNCLKEHKRRNPLLLFFSQFHNILIYILIVSSVVTSLLHHWVDTSVIAGVIIINAIIGFIQEGKAEKALDAISHMLPLQATVIRNGERQTINAIDLVPGDVVLLRAGDKVPADLRLIKTKNLQIQEATLTGESLPITKNTTTLPLDTNLGDRRCMAYSSTVVTYGRGRGIVVNTGEKTEIGRISALVAKAEMITTPLIRQISIFGRWLSAIILLISALTFFNWSTSLESIQYEYAHDDRCDCCRSNP